ncbi:MAG: PD40 domain-containing protein [Sedimentisphaerales bacterium]|nr:PD40 domain-containing protein [Sedimentisphaerales bacterium]
MMTTRRIILTGAIVFSAGILAVVCLRGLLGYTETIKDYTSLDLPAPIRPDYRDMVIPPNIAPLNFIVTEKATRYGVKIHADGGQPIELISTSPAIVIPQAPWRQLLAASAGKTLYLDVFLKDDKGRWSKFATITNAIAKEKIDDYLVYRKILPGHSVWNDIGIHQRRLSDFDESTILDNHYTQGVCINCHSFCNNRPVRMTIGIRSATYGSSALLVADGKAQKIPTKFGYTAWHPSGTVAAYSINKVRQFYHIARNEVREVVDLDSLLAYYVLETHTVKTAPQIARKDRLETYPTWSPDGDYLYFCSAPMPTAQGPEMPPDHYDQIRYDLVRIRYDIDHDTWGQLETVVPADQAGKSITLPRISPDGRWLLCCMGDFGCFPVYQPSSDLYIVDLNAAAETGRYEHRPLAINSSQSESWHCWSSNSRWIVFSSKRDYGVFTRLYISYIDETGQAHKPILLPQKDPTFYDAHLKTFSLPELIVEPVTRTKETLARPIRRLADIELSMDLPITGATLKAQKTGPWHERE